MREHLEPSETEALRAAYGLQPQGAGGGGLWLSVLTLSRRERPGLQLDGLKRNQVQPKQQKEENSDDLSRETWNRG